MSSCWQGLLSKGNGEAKKAVHKYHFQSENSCDITLFHLTSWGETFFGSHSAYSRLRAARMTVTLMERPSKFHFTNSLYSLLSSVLYSTHHQSPLQWAVGNGQALSFPQPSSAVISLCISSATSDFSPTSFFSWSGKIFQNRLEHVDPSPPFR